MDNEIKNPLRIDKVIMPLIRNIGFIGSIIMSVAYIIIVTILVVGFEGTTELLNNIVFAVVSAGVGVVIMQLLKWQGVQFAKELPQNIEVLKEYYVTPVKDRKFKSMTQYWRSSILKDIAIKALVILFFTGGIIYISIEGSGDYGLLLLGIANLLMFASFGFLSLASAYDFFNEQHINHLKQLIAEGKTSQTPKEKPISKKSKKEVKPHDIEQSDIKNITGKTSITKRDGHNVA